MELPPPATVPDRVRVLPGALSGRVQVPGDKSLSHRALIVGALADGPVEVSGLAASGDVRSTAGALRAFGARVELGPSADGGGALAGTVSGPVGEPADVVDCGNAGTAMRLLAGVAAGLSGLTVLTGDASLRRRPMDRVALPLRAMGAALDGRDGGRLPPLVVRGGRLRGLEHRSPVASAQVKSAVLLAGLTADGETVVVSPAPSRDHTERLLRFLGVDVRTSRDGDAERVAVTAAVPRARPVTVAADPSSAAFWMVAAAVAGTEVDLPGLCANPARLGVVEVLRAFGAAVEVTAEEERSGEPVATVRVTGGALERAVISGAAVVDAIDELPVLALAGARSRGGLEVRDAGELRVKESDRIAAVAAALGALGIAVEERPDGFRVPGGQRVRGGTVHSGGDHRIAMTAAVAATVADGPVTVEDFACVATSYPTFLDDLVALGGRVDRPAAAGVASGVAS